MGRLFTILSAVSLVLFVATCVLWVRSYYRQPSPAAYADRWLYTNGYVATDGGSLTVVYFDPNHGTARPFSHCNLRYLGFVFLQWQGNSGWNSDSQYTSIDVPLAVIAIPLGLMPALFIRRMAALPRGTNLCSKCGYDLRASPERCPECGTAR